MTPQTVYASLIRASQEASLLGSCAELLGWDEDTYMPARGGAHRGRQLALLAGLHHERSTDPRLGEWLAAVESSALVADPLSAPAVNVRLWRRAYDRACRVPRRLVEELADVTSGAQQAWASARRHNDFARLVPWLQKVVALKRDEAEALRGCKASHTSDGCYDALLEEYESGASAAALSDLFATLRKELTPLLQRIQGASRQADTTLLLRRYSLQRQRALVKKVATTLGFDFRGGRLDSTTHPFFSTIGPGDVRITTRYALNCFSEAFFATLHEVGHGLYEQGLPAEHHGTPLGEAPSLGMHESQARLWENAVGRSRGFWQYFFPQVQQAFPVALRDVALEDFYFAVHHVAPSFNRVQADEVTYDLHIAARFDLERAMIDGTLDVADLPAAWSEAYRRYLGVVPPDDAAGCLQDGHWAAGMFGYFPTYTLGNVFAAQLMKRAAAELGDLDEHFRSGQFDVLLGWLHRHVYREGSRYGAVRLVEHVTAAPPGPLALVRALAKRYGQVYGLA